VLAVLAIAVGAMALFLGWLGVSGKGYAFEQIPYVVSGGILGIFLLGLGGLFWMSADLRDEWRKLDDLERGMDALAAQLIAAGEGREPSELPSNGARPKKAPRARVQAGG
jgi:hypothetical protein